MCPTIARYCLLPLRPPRIHDLPTLLDLCILHDPLLATAQAFTDQFNPYGVLVRYPGFAVNTDDASHAVDAMRRLRRRMRYRLGI